MSDLKERLEFLMCNEVLRRSLRIHHSSLRSITYRKAPPQMRGTFQLVDHGDGVILN
jgi:hypothetical protein